MGEDHNNPAPQAAAEDPSAAPHENDDNVLSEEELDALQTTHPQASGSKGDCQGYDFRDPARILNSRLPGMDTVNESFTQTLEDKLHRFLRRAVVIQSSETMLSRQSDYMNALTLPASVQSVRLPGKVRAFM